MSGVLTAAEKAAGAQSASGVRSSWALREWGLVAAGYLLLTLVVTYPLLRFPTTLVPSGDGMLTAWALAWYAAAFPSRLETILTGPIFYPYQLTMLYDEHFFAQAVQAWPIIKLTGSPVLAYNLLLLSTFLLSAVGVYLLVRRWTGNRWAAFAAGALFSFSGVRLVHAGHLHILSVQWVPFSLWLLDRWIAVGRLRDLAGFTLAATAQLLSAYNFVLVYPLTVGVWCLVRLLSAPRLITRRTLGGLAAAAGVIALVNAPLGLLYLRLSEQLGFTRDAAETALYSASPLDYLVASPFSWLYGSLTAPWRHPAWTEHSLFPGITLLTLGAIGALSLALPVSRGRRGLLLAAVAVAGVTGNFSLGLAPLPPPLPDVRVYGLLYDLLPVTRGVRVPARAAVFVTLALALLAGFALAWLLPRLAAWPPLQRAGHSLGIGGAAVAALLITGFAVTESLSLPFLRPEERIDDHPPAVSRWLAEQPGRAPIVELPMLLHTREQWYETSRMLRGTLHWRPLLNGYRGFIPPTLKDLSRRMAGFPDDDTLAVLYGLGVEFVVVHRGEMPPTSFEALLRRAEARGMAPAATFDTALVYRVPEAPLAARDKVTLALEAPQHARAGERAEAWLILANADHAPFVPRIAEPYRLSVRWLAEGRRIAEQTVAVHQPLLVPAGDAVELPILIDVPRWTGPVRLLLEAQGELAGSGLRLEQDYLLSLR
ncbi:MAG: hypothetical protein RMM58_08430 [Chloroflexota bacterium]|nr:hypothetical protein [Dehalococcoidia bacterium]MDW8253890.1 hypothetical protein [Chloroflexota bacterium]